jgi:hypothetical protein
MTMKHKIHKDLIHLAVEVAALTPDPRNARSHDERNLKAVIDSLERHGQVKPIVVQLKSDSGLDFVIRAGNATTEAASRLGWTHVAAVMLDYGDIEARAYALRDNRTAELAEWDLPNLGAEMRDLRDAGFDVAVLGWEIYEYEPLMEAVWTPPTPTGEEFEQPGKGHSIKFTDEQYEQLTTAIGTKTVKAADIVARLAATQ